MKRHIFVIVLIFILTINIFGQGNFEDAMVFEASYVNDYVHNLTGGLKTGQTAMGMIDLVISMNTESAGLWKNGEFYMQIENTHGGSLSGSFLGDLQVASNIDNGDYTYLYMLWYKHVFGKLSLTLGKHDLNSEFLVSDYAGEYVNSSFGIMPPASWNAPVCIFPKNSLAAMLKYNHTDQLAVQVAIYDGDPLDLEVDPYSLDHKISSDEGFFTVGEIHYSTELGENKPGTYKLGAFYHTADFIDITDPTKEYQGNFGIYGIADQMILPKGDSRGLGVFLKCGFAPDNRNLNDLFFGLGFNYYGLLDKRSEDVAGLAIAFASISNQLVDATPYMLGSETAIEAFYRFHISDHIEVQPEFQYILNTGANKDLDNCLIGLIRTYINF